MSRAQELRVDRHRLSVDMNAALDKNDLTEWKRLDGIQDGLRMQIEAIERSANLDKEMRTVPNAERPNIGDPESYSVLTPSQQARSTASYKASFDSFLRTGERNAELRALGDASGAQGAQLVPQGFERELEVKLKYWNGIANIARVVNTPTGNPLLWPVMDDSSNSGEWLAEAGAVTNADPTFTNVTLGANLLSSKQVKVSVALAQDSAFDMGALLLDAFGERLGRAQDTAYWTGDGSTIPVTGLLTALQAAGGRSVLNIGANNNSGNAGDTSLTSIGTDDFSNLIDKLDYAYQKPTNKFVFSQTTKNSIRKLKDKYGRSLWATSMTENTSDTIMGFGYIVDNAFANIGAGNISVCFGDFSRYVIRRALGITLVRFNELYMPNYQIAFQAFLRTDAKLLQAAAFSYLTHPLS
jgi:HK97 family phage major capsid protein